jgi:hypothetical protein
MSQKITVLSTDLPLGLRLNAHLIRFCHMDQAQTRFRGFFLWLSPRLTGKS